MKRILIVDDDTDHLWAARTLLESEGYEVLTHQSPFGVVGLIQASEPELVLVDGSFPFSPGVDLTSHLRSDDRTRTIPVVLYSSDDERTLNAAVAKHGLRGYIRKGDPNELRMKASYFLGRLEADVSAFGRRLYAVE